MVLKTKRYNKWYYPKKYRKRVDYFLTDLNIKENLEKIYNLLSQDAIDNIIIEVSIDHQIKNIDKNSIIDFENKVKKYKSSIKYIYNYNYERLFGVIYLENNELDLDLFKSLINLFENIEIYHCKTSEMYRTIIERYKLKNRKENFNIKNKYLISPEEDSMHIVVSNLEEKADLNDRVKFIFK